MEHVTITESGMTFGAFDVDDVFAIEKSKQYQKLQEQVKVVEFVLRRNGKILFIEAKSSSPNPKSITESEEKQEKFDDHFINSPKIFGLYFLIHEYTGRTIA